LYLKEILIVVTCVAQNQEDYISATSSRNTDSGGEFLTIFTFVKSGTGAAFGAVNGRNPSKLVQKYGSFLPFEARI
jgi:hypothetical protein